MVASPTSENLLILPLSEVVSPALETRGGRGLQAGRPCAQPPPWLVQLLKGLALGAGLPRAPHAAICSLMALLPMEPVTVCVRVRASEVRCSPAPTALLAVGTAVRHAARPGVWAMIYHLCRSSPVMSY